MTEKSLPRRFQWNQSHGMPGFPATNETMSGVKERDGILIQTIGPGDVLGWSWLFPPYYWHFDARAATTVKAIFFCGAWLREYGEQNHNLGYELMKRTAEVVIKRLQAARKYLVELRTEGHT